MCNQEFKYVLIKCNVPQWTVFQSVIRPQSPDCQPAEKNSFTHFMSPKLRFFYIYIFTLFILGIKIQFNAPLEIINY